MLRISNNMIEDPGTKQKLSDKLAAVDASLADMSSDDTFKNNHFLSHLNSYMGVQNTGYTGDNGSRFYILPKDHVTTGTGGALKIFGDAYQLGQDYRDFGIYFSADQNGDKGSNGTGVFWFNGKVYDIPGAMYLGKNPDIGFSFQDGQAIAGRISYVNGNPFFVIGSSLAKFANANSAFGMELEKHVVFWKDKGIYFESASGTADKTIRSNSTTDRIEIYDKSTLSASFESGKVNTHQHLFFDKDKYLYFSGSDNQWTNAIKYNTSTPQFEFLTKGTVRLSISDSDMVVNNTLKVAKAIVRTDLWNVTNVVGNAGNVANYNRVKFAQPSADTIPTLGGTDGQRIICLFTNGNTTIQNNSTIKLKGGVNYVSQADEVMVLENFGGVWYEISRSADHA